MLLHQIVLETLADLMADASVLPDLFFNYDCDTQRTDVLESLTKALADAIKVRPTDHADAPQAMSVCQSATTTSQY